MINERLCQIHAGPKTMVEWLRVRNEEDRYKIVVKQGRLAEIVKQEKEEKKREKKEQI